MSKQLLIAASCMLASLASFSQSKVFKEVADDISSQMQIITQDDALIGYLVFTKLEQANADSFNYQITIMDENLNDIGKMNFREQNLELHGVAFEQDVICLAYLKSKISEYRTNKNKEVRAALEKENNAVFTQFIDLKGNILRTHAYSADLKIKEWLSQQKTQNPSIIAGDLKHNIILKNIPQKGFMVFYGDLEKNNLVTFSAQGNQVWHKTVPAALDFAVLTTPQNIHILSRQKSNKLEGGFELASFNAADGQYFPSRPLKDTKGNELKVLSFQNDPATGKAMITGTIINRTKGNEFGSVTQLSRGTYDGVFTMLVNGPKKEDVKPVYSYWNDGSHKPAISASGRFDENDTYTRLTTVVRDFNGNTYFAGPAYEKKFRPVKLAITIITAPLFVPPLILLTTGLNKTKAEETVLLKQSASGKLSVARMISGDNARYYPAASPLPIHTSKRFYSVSNSDTKSNFLIINDLKNIFIYNMNTGKVAKVVAKKDGSSTTSIFPAKEGHIMVVETNKKEKFTRLSIESL